MKLEIVIPAFNEEQSIKSIVQRCIDSKIHIIKETKSRKFRSQLLVMVQQITLSNMRKNLGK